MGKFIDLTGEKYGKLTVLKREGKDRQKCLLWKCKCDCGNEIIVRGSSLRNSHTQSCGCHKTERLKKTHYIHGKARTKIYKCWKSMIDRCYNENNSSYHNYGGRGIGVCKEWLDGKTGLINFWDWSINNGFDKHLSIDRIDNNKGYAPDNCRWTTMKVQSMNKRNNHNITFQRQTKCMTAWGEDTGLTANCLSARLNHYKWPIEKALTSPSRKHPKQGVF